MNKGILINFKLRLLLRDAASINDMLPTFNTFPGLMFHKCIATGITTAATANNHKGFKNWNNVYLYNAETQWFASRYDFVI